MYVCIYHSNCTDTGLVACTKIACGPGNAVALINVSLLPLFPPLECPIEGQVFTTCGTACPPTCSQPGPVLCTDQCVEGCQCPPGTVLDEKNKKCVMPDQCGQFIITHTYNAVPFKKIYSHTFKLN